MCFLKKDVESCKIRICPNVSVFLQSASGTGLPLIGQPPATPTSLSSTDENQHEPGSGPQSGLGTPKTPATPTDKEMSK